MTSFTDITESIKYIRNNNKQKATTERIFNLLKKRDHEKDLSTLDLEEEYNTLVPTETLYKNNKNSLFIGTLSNTAKKDHKPNELSDHFTDAESNGNESQMTTDLEILTTIEKDQSDNPKDTFSVSADKLDTWQNFFLIEISDIKAEIKNTSLQKSLSFIRKPFQN